MFRRLDFGKSLSMTHNAFGGANGVCERVNKRPCEEVIPHQVHVRYNISLPTS